MQKFTPFLWFSNNAEDALNFYLSVFKDAKAENVQYMPEGGPGPAGSFMTGSFTTQGQTFHVLNGANEPFTAAVSFMITCKDQEEVDYYWEKFADGGQPLMCGWIKDKFGVTWQVTPEILLELMQNPDREKAYKTMQAMMTMQKIDIKGLQDA